MKGSQTSLLITCEHGGNDVPREVRRHFESPDAIRHLNSHRGWDPGALRVARRVADLLDAPLVQSTVSRLVVDLNRSLDSPELFSKFIPLDEKPTRDAILGDYYHPYRQQIVAAISNHVGRGNAVLHLSIHTFTPRYRGEQRTFDAGVLFDPDRSPESKWSERLRDQLGQQRFRTVANQPYLGIDDGFTTTLRHQFPAAAYSGIELEINNRFAKQSQRSQDAWCDRIAAAVKATIADADQRHFPN